MKNQPFLRDIVWILGAGIVLALMVNAFSVKPLPFLRESVEKVAVSDAALFTPPPHPADTNGTAAARARTRDRRDIPVIAPLHEKALANPESSAAAAGNQSSSKKIRIISLDQFLRLMRTSKPVVIDGRDSASYLKGHVKGARNVYGLAVGDYFDRLVYIPRDTLIIVYCNNPDCHLGRMVVEFMTEIGFTNIYLYDDGWDGWEHARMPVDTIPVKW